MAERETRETVVVEGDRSPSYGWVIALVVIALIVILFFVFGGANLFSGAEAGTETINVETPDTINVETTPSTN